MGTEINKKQQQGGKPEYQPPSVVRIHLRPEEAVLGHCKTSSARGPIGSSCRLSSCPTLGS